MEIKFQSIVVSFLFVHFAMKEDLVNTPIEIIRIILYQLSPIDVVKLSFTCKHFRYIGDDEV